jgi:hypothetical protein
MQVPVDPHRGGERFGAVDHHKDRPGGVRPRLAQAGGSVALARTAARERDSGHENPSLLPCSGPRSTFAGFRFPRDVIVLAVGWYLRFGLSYRDVEELLAGRGVEVDRSASTAGCRASRRSWPTPPSVIIGGTRSSRTFGAAITTWPLLALAFDELALTV